MKEKSKTSWPTKAVMNQIYDMNLWGGNDVDFYSGEGSHNSEIIKPYIETVISFLSSHNSLLTVCDLGCGDFNIGQHLVAHTKNYIAIDIVENLIDRNKALFQKDNLEFKCLDISKDDLPKADCVILRQVLQHLSNSEIKNIIKKLYSYKYIILTEHLPNGNFQANKDKIASQGIRLKQNSGVDLLEAPFNFKISDKNILSEVVLENNNGKIVTTLYTL